MSCSRGHRKIFHLVSSGIRTSNLSVTGPTLLTARRPAANCQSLPPSLFHPPLFFFSENNDYYFTCVKAMTNGMTMFLDSLNDHFGENTKQNFLNLLEPNGLSTFVNVCTVCIYVCVCVGGSPSR